MDLPGAQHDREAVEHRRVVPAHARAGQRALDPARSDRLLAAEPREVEPRAEGAREHAPGVAVALQRPLPPREGDERRLRETDDDLDAGAG